MRGTHSYIVGTYQYNDMQEPAIYSRRSTGDQTLDLDLMPPVMISIAWIDAQNIQDARIAFRRRNP